MHRNSLSLIIPVYNEASTIRAIVERVFEVVKECAWDAEVIVVDDGSRDGTAGVLAKVVEELGMPLPLRVLTHPVNRGKGAAIRTGLQAVTKEFVVVQDADLEYDPREIDALLVAMGTSCTTALRSVEAGQAVRGESKDVLVGPKGHRTIDVVYGSRVLGARAKLSPQRRNIYAMGVWTLTLAVRWLYGLKLTDEATCYKLFRTSDLRRMELTCERFEFCPEVTAKAVRLGLSILEVPISYTPRSAAAGKKIRLRDAFEAFRTLWKFRHWLPTRGIGFQPVGLSLDLPTQAGSLCHGRVKDG